MAVDYYNGFMQPQYPNQQYGNTPVVTSPSYYAPQTVRTMNQPMYINGKVINAAADIMPNDIPMDGRMTYFPMSDNSKIYVKFWKPDGTISTLEFSPVVKSDETVEDPIKILEQRVEKIEKRLYQSHNKNQKSYQDKKSGDDNND